MSNEEELTQTITDILQNDPHGVTDISALGTQLQKITGQSWNIKFKPRYGPLADFVHHRPEFHLDGTHVYLRKKWLLVKAEKEEKQLKKQQKKARREGKEIEPNSPNSPSKGQVNGDKKKTSSQAGYHEKKKKKGSGFCFNLFIFLIFLSILVLSLLYLYNNGYLKPYLKPYQPQIDQGIREGKKKWAAFVKWSSKEFKYLAKKGEEVGRQAFSWIQSQLKKYKLIN